MSSIEWNLQCMKELNDAAKKCLSKIEYGHTTGNNDNYELAVHIDLLCQDIQEMYDDLLADYGDKKGDAL